MQGLIGKKLGMTQVYDDDGARVAVTLVQAGPCVVVQRKTKPVDGYDAVQVGFGDKKESRVNKAQAARFKKVEASPKAVLREFPVGEGDELRPGDTVTAVIFEGTTHVDVTGITKGRGFQGVVKRHRMAGGRMTHGGHSRRRVGAIGQCAYPSRVAKGQRMPGHMGHVRVTQQNLRLVGVRGDENLLLIGGAVPGPTGAIVLVSKSLKRGGPGK